MPELKLSFPSSKAIIQDYGIDYIKKCASQNENLLLKTLTSEVLQVFEAGGR